jgi:hypothetical protein
MNLKRIVQALHAYHEVNHHLPPPAIYAEGAGGMGGPTGMEIGPPGGRFPAGGPAAPPGFRASTG